MTAKYRGAVAIAHKVLNLSYMPPTQEKLYGMLQLKGYFWNSDVKEWEYHDAAEADAPTPLVMVRVWADLQHVDDYAQQVAEKCTQTIGPLVEQSKTYPNRPPKQLEGRVYLKFMPRNEQ
jgi:hypothetical protein